MADMILAAEEDGEDTDSLFGLVYVEPIDRPIDRPMSQTR